MKNWLIPHPNIPNAEFGDAHLKRVTTLFNENFAKLDALMQSAQSSVSSLESSKSNDGHKHDEDYAQLEHKHVPDDVTGLSDLLDNKANLNHEHSQYLTEITAHQHETNEINGLIEALNGKAPTAHGHTFADVDGLDDLSASAARTAYVDQRDTEKLAVAKAYTDAQMTTVPSIVNTKVDEKAADVGQSQQTVGSMPNETMSEQPVGILWSAGGTTGAKLFLFYQGEDDGAGGHDLHACQLVISKMGTIARIQTTNARSGVNIIESI